LQESALRFIFAVAKQKMIKQYAKVQLFLDIRNTFVW